MLITEIMTEVFLATPRFCQAVQIINAIDNSKFPRLLSRVAEKLHVRGDKAFSSDETVKLQSALGLSSADVDLLLETIEFVLQQAAYYGMLMKPSVLQQQLEAVNINAEKCSATVNAWSLYGKTVVEKLKKHSFVQKQLKSVDWDMNLQLAQASKTQLKETNAIFHLNLSNSDTGETDKLLLEFTHEELLDFYGKLELIESQLDSLS